MSVVARCPNCGTTQAKTGECEACHEAQVRYFCTNHEPGVWLAGPTCPQCEARATPPARASAAPSRRPDPRPSPRVASADPPPPPPEEAAPDAAPPALWKQLLRAAVASRLTPRGPDASSARAPTSSGLAGGWLRRLALRLVLIVVVLVVAVVGAVYMLAQSWQ